METTLKTAHVIGMPCALMPIADLSSARAHAPRAIVIAPSQAGVGSYRVDGTARGKGSADHNGSTDHKFSTRLGLKSWSPPS